MASGTAEQSVWTACGENGVEWSLLHQIWQSEGQRVGGLCFSFLRLQEMDVFSSVLSPSRRVLSRNQVILISDRLRLPLLSFPCEVDISCLSSVVRLHQSLRCAKS